MSSHRLEIFGVDGIGEIRPGDDLASVIVEATTPDVTIVDGDVVVVTQKIVSKAEGQLARTEPDDPRGRKIVEAESAKVIRRRGDLVISQTRHGFICANAGVDLSNVDEGWAALLPKDPDRSARRIRDGLEHRTGAQVAVIISDTFGRVWRKGVTDVAIGCAGIGAILDLRGTQDATGRELAVTEVAIVDEIAAAADLVMGKATAIPVAILRGIDGDWLRRGEVRGEIVRKAEEDLFR